MSGYVVTEAMDLGDLERGLVMYEVSDTAKPGRYGPLIAGFVFVKPHPARLSYLDPHELWDFREVDGKPFPRWRKSMKWGDAKRWDDLEAGLTAAIETYQGGKDA